MKNVIENTNRVFLFEEINPNKLNILTILGDIEKNSTLSDQIIEDINKELVVSSFKEFLEKFEPTIYSYYDVETQDINYTTKIPENMDKSLITEIKIDLENHFLKMLISLIESRKNQGVKSIDFKFENILNLLSPKKIIEDIKQNRKEIEYLYSKYTKLDDENPEKEEYAHRLNLKFESVSKHYNNTLSMLPLAIEDIKTKVLLKDIEYTKKIEKINAGLLQISEQGNLQIISINKNDNLNLIEVKKTNDELSEIYRNDYREVTKSNNKYVEDLVVRTFAPLSTNLIEVDYEKEISKYNNYLSFYKSSQEKFIKVAKPLIETILSVKLFFDQYDVKIEKNKPKLLITNVKNDLLTLPNNIKRIESYLLNVNSKNDLSNSIWFAIYPNIDLESENKDVKKRFKSNTINKKNYTNNLEEFSTIISILAKYKVQTFINFSLTENMTFEKLSIEELEKIESKLEKLTNKSYSEYIIPVMPNFTIIPKTKSEVILDNKLDIVDNEVKISNEEVKFWIDGIYISSSYVAAGLTASYQCCNYMKDRYKSILNDIPSVRFNIESENNYLLVKTTMPRETSGYTVDLKNKINSNNFGFIFSSDLCEYNRETITNITVYKSRCLLKDIDGYYEPLFKTTASTYIERVIRYMTSDFKLDKLNFFFSNSPNSQKSMWLKDNNYVNSIIQKGDSIDAEIDEKNNSFKLKLKFSGGEKNLTFEMNKN